MYWLAHDMGAPGPPLRLVVHEIERRIAYDPKLTDGLLRVFNHNVTPSPKVLTRPSPWPPPPRHL